jgi:hypothetical protein
MFHAGIGEHRHFRAKRALKARQQGFQKETSAPAFRMRWS